MGPATGSAAYAPLRFASRARGRALASLCSALHGRDHRQAGAVGELCNLAKRDMAYDAFLALCSAISANHTGGHA